MGKTFKSETSYLAWKLFKQKGEIGYMMLHLRLENLEKYPELNVQDELEK